MTNISLANSFQTASLHEIENIEEFQPLLELVSPSHVPSILLNDIVSSLFPTISAPFTSSASSNIHPLVIRSEHHNADHINQIPYMSFDDTSNMPELLLIGSPSTLTSTLIQSDFNSTPSRNVHSLLESIEELCLLIRQLLDRELPGQKVTSLQATIANQLAILLTYLAIPNNEKIIPTWRTENTMEKMTSTEEDLTSFQKSLFVTNGTQTDLVWNILLNDSIPQSMNVPSENIHSEKDLADDAMKFTVYKSPSISENEREKMIDIALSSQRGTSQTELTSASGKDSKQIFKSFLCFSFSHSSFTWSSTSSRSFRHIYSTDSSSSRIFFVLSSINLLFRDNCSFVDASFINERKD